MTGAHGQHDFYDMITHTAAEAATAGVAAQKDSKLNSNSYPFYDHNHSHSGHFQFKTIGLSNMFQHACFFITQNTNTSKRNYLQVHELNKTCKKYICMKVDHNNELVM